ncbi:MAG TPA: hypothetical protein VHN18_19690 [Micromonosporaceae bacterium]|nr:hypothetical protein [Micromonosporaceae bacterium]
MSKVMTGATMSLDGYISGPNETGFDLLFRWYSTGDVETPTANPQMTLRTSAASAGHLRELQEKTGALVVGRHLYDMTNGWGGRHPMDVPVVVLTHRPPTDRPRRTRTSRSSARASRRRSRRRSSSPATRRSA